MWIRRFPLICILAIALGLVVPALVYADRSTDRAEEADRHIQAGDYLSALSRLNQHLEKRPRDLEARGKRGSTYLRLHEPNQALADFDAVLRVMPWSYALHVDRGIARVMMGDYEEARRDFEQALKLMSLTFRRDQVSLANAHAGLGQVAHRLGQDEEAIQAYSKAIDANPSDPSGYLGRGEALVALKQLDRALVDLDQAVRLGPNQARAFTFRGDLLWQLKQYDRALADLDRAIELNPRSAEARSRRGSLLAQLGANERALTDLDELVRLEPRRAAAYKDRGGVLVRLGQYDRAISDLDKSIRLDPNRSTSYQNRGAAYSGLAQYDRAAEDLNQAVHLDPKNAGARTNLGLALFAMGQYEKALAEMTEAVRLAPENAIVYLNRAGAYSRLGRLEEAVADYNQALRHDPKALMAYVGLGQAQANLGRRGQAIHSFDMALQLNPTNSHVLASRGNSRRAEGDWQGAIEDFTKAIQLDPRYAEAYVLRGWSLLCTDQPGADTDARTYLSLRDRPDVSTLYMSLLGALGSRRASKEADARLFLSEALAGRDQDQTWPLPVLRYMERGLSAQGMLESAGDQAQKTEAHVFLALDLIQTGKPEWALEHLRWAREHGATHSSSADLARIVLSRLEPTATAERAPRIGLDSTRSSDKPTR